MFTCPIGEAACLALLEPRHSAALASLVRQNLDRLIPWLPWAHPSYSESEAATFIQMALAQYGRSSGFHAGIFEGDRLMGCVGVHDISHANRSTSVGYWISKEAEGHGLVSSAVGRVLEYLFFDMHLHRVEIRCGVTNLRSRRIPDRLGFKHEGVLRQAQFVAGRWIDLEVWSLLEPEWKAGRC